MVMAVVPRDDAEGVLQALVGAGHTATFVEGRGGVLRQAKKMLFIAVEDEALEQVLNVVRRSCHSQAPVESGASGGGPLLPDRPAAASEMGGMAVFVWDLERFEIY
jgi:uncharacterized protein YaaQ